MLNKIQSYLNLVLVLFAIFGIVYFIVLLVMDAFQEEVYITQETLGTYTTDANLVTSYTVFNVVEQATSNFYEAMINENYDDIYGVINSKTKDELNREEILKTLVEYNKNILGANDIMSGHSVWLKKAYEINNGYIAEIKSTYSDTSLFIIFNIDMYELTYTIDLII